MCRININQELNGIELSFESKPERAILDEIKANGFRWNGKKHVWYAKKTADRLTFAETLGEIKSEEKTADTINLANLGENCPESFWMDGGLSKAIREDLKRRGVKGCTVRQSSSGYTPAITVTVKATAEDIASIEEAKQRYSFSEFVFDMSNHGKYCGDRWIYSNEWETMSEEDRQTAYNNYIKYTLSNITGFPRYHHERRECWELTSAFYNKCIAVFKIADQWNHDNSDSMSDYFDVGYYLDIDIKKPAEFEPRQDMTEAERTAYEEEKKAEAAAEEARRLEWEREQEERKKAHEEAEKKRKADTELIYNNCIIEDLEEDEQIYITDLIGGIGKECTLAELDETIKERIADHENAFITRKVIFTTPEAFEAFGRNLLEDFIFLSGKGGTGSDDVRLETVEAIYKLNTTQRNSIEWAMCNCVAIYNGDQLQLVSNPEGHHYSRYTYRVTETSEIKSATAESERVRTESESKSPFYFPDDVEAQCNNNLYIGQEITVYQCDGWILNNVYAGSGIVTGWTAGTYAQHTGMYINLKEGKKEYSVFIRNTNECLIYEGIKPKLPDTVTCRRLSAYMVEMFNHDKLLPNILEYYGDEKPIIDTVQR